MQPAVKSTCIDYGAVVSRLGSFFARWRKSARIRSKCARKMSKTEGANPSVASLDICGSAVSPSGNTSPRLFGPVVSPCGSTRPREQPPPYLCLLLKDERRGISVFVHHFAFTSHSRNTCDYFGRFHSQHWPQEKLTLAAGQGDASDAWALQRQELCGTCVASRKTITEPIRRAVSVLGEMYALFLP